MRFKYLNPAVFTWPCYPEISTFDNSDWRKPYEHWQHALELAKKNNNSFERIDIITTLKRALNIRIKHIKYLYKFDKLPITLPKHDLQKLEVLGIARHFLAVHLIDIRNNIEHQDSLPPNSERCMELVDFVWYFLKSTDRITMYVNGTMEYLYDDADNYSLEINTGPSNNWRFNYFATLPFSYVIDDRQDGWVQVVANQFELRGKDTIWMEGNIPKDSQIAKDLVLQYFSLI